MKPVTPASTAMARHEGRKNSRQARWVRLAVNEKRDWVPKLTCGHTQHNNRECERRRRRRRKTKRVDFAQWHTSHEIEVRTLGGGQ